MDGSTKSASTIQVKKVGANFGAEISNIDLTQKPDEATVQAVGDALAEHELLIFPDQDISSDNLVDFGRCFGELTVHPFSPNRDETPHLILFDNNKDNPPFGTDVWHSDETFRECPPMGTMLCSKNVPEVGGDTMYVSMSSAFDGLSDRMQNFISGLEAIHDFKPFRKLFAADDEGRANLQMWEREYPPVLHPVVRKHPVTGRKVLFVNPQFTLSIKDMDEKESTSLLQLLFQQALIPEYQYRHHWQNNVLAFWDNRSAQHYAIHDYYPQRRQMERVTIGGDRPLGFSVAEASEI
jgi:taurine dioxygenase